MKRFIDLAPHPEVVEEDGEFASNSHDGAFLGILTTTPCECEPPAPQVSVGPEGTEDILSGLNKKPA